MYIGRLLGGGIIPSTLATAGPRHVDRSQGGIANPHPCALRILTNAAKQAFGAGVAAPETSAPCRTAPCFASPPFVFLMTLAFVNWVGFASWQALLNNFAKDAAGLRRLPDRRAPVGARDPGASSPSPPCSCSMIMREQTLAYLSILMPRRRRGDDRAISHRSGGLIPHDHDHVRGASTYFEDGEPGALAPAASPARRRPAASARSTARRRRRSSSPMAASPPPSC